jgi:hypothetical protein
VAFRSPHNTQFGHVAPTTKREFAAEGLGHEKLTCKYAGRDFRLTDVKGSVGKEIFA